MVSHMITLQRKQVCVIGAGMAGLAAARELRREGHDVTVLEQSGDVGGQWLYDPSRDVADDPLGAEVPVKVHSSIYASLRLISARENMGFTDFLFARRDGRDRRRFPGHREVYLYLKDFCDAFGLMESVRLNTRVLRVAMAQGQWAVRSVGLGRCDEEEKEEVFDAVVVANGHYSQPRLPRIQGMEAWSGRQMHSHSYRTPEPFRGEVVVVVGAGESGRDIAMEVRKVAKEVHLIARREVTPGLAKVLGKHSATLRLQPHLDRLCDDGRVVFGDGSSVVADTVIYCTGYDYSFPFLDTAGAVTVDDNRVGPLFEHVFPPSLAPSLSFIGIPKKVFAPWFFEAQAKWVAQVLSGRSTLPSEEEMMRAVEEHYRACEIAGVRKKDTHDLILVDITYMDEFVDKYCGDFPRMEKWNLELLLSSLTNMDENLETFRDEYQDTDSIREGVEAWHLAAAQQLDQTAAVGAQIQSLGLPEQEQY